LLFGCRRDAGRRAATRHAIILPLRRRHTSHRLPMPPRRRRHIYPAEVTASIFAAHFPPSFSSASSSAFFFIFAASFFFLQVCFYRQKA